MVRTSYIINIDAKLLMTSSTNELKNLHDEKKAPFTFARLKKGWTLKGNLKLVSSGEKGGGPNREGVYKGRVEKRCYEEKEEKMN